MEENRNLSEMSKLVHTMQDRIADALIQQILFVNASDIFQTISVGVKELFLTQFETSFYVSKEMQNILLENLKQIAKMLTDCYWTGESVEVSIETMESFHKFAPYVPEKEQEEFNKIIAPEKSNQRKILTVENVKWLLGIIIPILFTLYLHQLPDKNAEESLQLQKEQIATEQEENALQRESTELLREFFEYIEENGVSFPEQIGPLREQIDAIENDTEVIQNLVVPDAQHEEADDQEENQDLQQ